MLGAKDQLHSHGLGIVDAVKSRQFYSAPSRVRYWRKARKLPRNVVLHLGNNGIVLIDYTDILRERDGMWLRVVDVIAALEGRTYAADDSVAFGMTATVRLERAGATPVARLPLAAVLNRGNGPAVYRLDDNSTLALQPVTVAAFTEDAALVTSGLKDGDTVATLGVQKLEAGLRVRPLARY